MADFSGRDTIFWLRFALVVTGAIVAVFLIRQLFVAPIDSLAVREACASHGFDIDHPLTSVDQVNTDGIFNRVTATCLYGPSEDQQRDALSRSLDEIKPGGFFTAAKFLGVFLQLGTLAVYARLVGEPMYRKFILER